MEQYRRIHTEVAEIGRYDAAVLSLRASELYSEGYEPGDLVTVRFPERVFVMPVGKAYSDVDNFRMILMEIPLDGRMLAAINNGDTFAGLYGIHAGDPVQISMKKKAGYQKEYELRACLMTADRADYATDEIFANFRYVTAGDILPGRLYRGMSPINPEDGRNAISDKLLAQTEVRTVINLDGETEDFRRRYHNYENTYYRTLRIEPIKICFSARNPQFFAGMGTICRTIIEDDGPYLIHCRYARDRTGNVCAVLEALCGASMEEIRDDYMLSYENIHHIEHGSPKWEFHAGRTVNSFFAEITGIADPSALGPMDLKEAIRELLMERSGLTEEELDGVYGKLCREPGKAGSRE